jgi:hypothetical protein
LALRSTSAISLPRSLALRINEPTVFKPKLALPAPITTILVGNMEFLWLFLDWERVSSSLLAPVSRRYCFVVNA